MNPVTVWSGDNYLQCKFTRQIMWACSCNDILALAIIKHHHTLWFSLHFTDYKSLSISTKNVISYLQCVSNLSTLLHLTTIHYKIIQTYSVFITSYLSQCLYLNLQYLPLSNSTSTSESVRPRSLEWTPERFLPVFSYLCLNCQAQSQHSSPLQQVP